MEGMKNTTCGNASVAQLVKQPELTKMPLFHIFLKLPYILHTKGLIYNDRHIFIMKGIDFWNAANLGM